MTLVERFLKYVSFDTQSSEETEITPSTPGQMVFARYLKEELETLGLEEITLDENGYLFATLPANTDKPLPVYMAMARGGREFFITGHSEYSPYTLNDEYMRDLGKGLPINKPRNYYRNNDPAQGPVVRWRGHANLLFTNWLNYYVYQETPFRREDIKKLGSL